MLNFTEYLEKYSTDKRRKEYRWECEKEYDISLDVCRYILAMHESKKFIRIDHYILKSLIDFFGHEWLEEAADLLERHFKRYFEGTEEAKNAKLQKIARAKKLKNCLDGWASLHKLLGFEVNVAFKVVLKYYVQIHMAKQQKSVFETRLNLLCKALGLDNINKEFLRFIYLYNYESLVEELHDRVCKSLRVPQSKISYAVIALLTGYPEEKVLESISGERGVTNLGILVYGGRSSIEIPHEIRRYLKGLGSDNLIDIYATADKQTPLALEKFTFQKEAQFITDLISMHKNERPLHFLLYGMEGTGKTELARTIAANANCDLLDIGRGLKKRIFEDEGDLTDSVVKFRIRALNVAEIMFRNKSNLVLLVERLMFCLIILKKVF